MRSYTRALVLAAALGLLLGAAAGCVAPATETPSPAAAATPPTAVAGAAGTLTPQPPTTAPTATAVPTALPTGTTALPAAGATATAVPPAARAATAAASPAAPTATPAATGTAAATVAATQTVTATPACCVGQRCVVDGVAFTVRNVSSSQTVSDVATPQPGQTLLVTDVTIENVGTQPVAYRPQLFKVRAEDGAEHEARTIVPDESGEPGPGEVVLLRVVFEVPDGARDFTLVYSPPTLGAQQVEVDLSCSRPGQTPTP